MAVSSNDCAKRGIIRKNWSLRGSRRDRKEGRRDGQTPRRRGEADAAVTAPPALPGRGFPIFVSRFRNSGARMERTRDAEQAAGWKSTARKAIIIDTPSPRTKHPRCRMRALSLVSFLILIAVNAYADCDPALVVPSDGTGIATPVIFSEVNPGDYI